MRVGHILCVISVVINHFWIFALLPVLIHPAPSCHLLSIARALSSTNKWLAISRSLYAIGVVLGFWFPLQLEFEHVKIKVPFSLH